ncbi:MAG: GNAT family N-acetyltransferase [Caulobacter sp.]|nr:GNAT family N-acetyltransferase [Caulobacter sp.]
MAIRTANLRLEPARLDDLETVARGDGALCAALGLSVAPHWAGPDALAAIGRSRDFLIANPGSVDWWMHFIVHVTDIRLIGLGGFKGEPEDGTVEIGYELAPGYRGRGLATEAARGMVDHAFANPGVDRVIAHTLPTESASTTILKRLGLRFDGELDDPDDGYIWRWRLERAG